MTFADFDKFQRQLFDDCINMRNLKGREYCVGDNRFENFETEAHDLGVHPLVVASIFANKHVRSIKAYIAALNSGRKIESTEPIYGRFIDAITYFSLMAGMISEIESAVPEPFMPCPHGQRAGLCTTCNQD